MFISDWLPLTVLKFAQQEKLRGGVTIAEEIDSQEWASLIRIAIGKYAVLQTGIQYIYGQVLGGSKICEF